jgi:hypothetical protein
MKDICERLRCWTHAVDAQPASDLMDEAADEIARLRLTDAEREDMECAASRLQSDANGPRDLQVAATLRGLLERLGGGK